MEVKFIEIKGVRDYIDVIYNDVKNSDTNKIQVAYDGKDIKAIINYFYKIEQENNKLKKEKEDLQERIDKAIESIEKEIEYYKDQSGSLMIIEMLKCLLEILKGSNK